MNGSLRRLAKVIGIGIGCVLLGFCVLVTSAMLWLRTEAGETWLCDRAVAALKEAGITASFTSVMGPLPGVLHVTGLTLADDHGVWFSLPEGTVRLRLSDILFGQATVEELSLFAPCLERLPVLPPSPDPAPSSTPLNILEPDNLGVLSSTIKTILEHATLEKFRIEGLHLGADVAGAPIQLRILGGGPLSDFSTQFCITTPLFNGIPLKSVSKDASPPNLEGLLRIGNSGDWLSSPIQAGRKPDAAVLLEFAFPAGNDPTGNLEKSVLLNLHLLLTLRGPELAVEDLRLTAPGGTITGTRLALSNMKLSGNLVAEVTDPVALLNLTVQPDEKISTPVDAVRTVPFATVDLQSVFSGTLDDPQLDIRFQVSDITAGFPELDSPPSLGGHLRVSGQEVFTAPFLRANGTVWLSQTSFPADYEADNGKLLIRIEQLEAARTDAGLELRALHLTSDILELESTACLSETGSFATGARLILPNLRLLFDRLGTVFPVAALFEDPLHSMAGTLELNLNASRAEGDYIGGAFGFSSQSMNWGIPQVQSLLGPASSLTFQFAVQPHPSGPAVTVRDLKLAGKELTGKGSLALTPDARLTADILLHLASLACLDGNFSGELDMKAHVAGPMQNPALKMELNSPNLGAGMVFLEQLRVLFEANHIGAASGNGQLLVTGNVNAQGAADLRESGAIRLHTDWNLTPEVLLLKNMAFSLPGATLKGGVEANLANAPVPLLAGTLALDIADWAALSVLAGVPLHGAPAHFRLHADHSSGQHMDADWVLGSFTFGGFSLSSSRGHASVDDLYGALRIRSDADIGGGTFSPMEFGWRKGALTVTGNDTSLHVGAVVQGRTSLDFKAKLNLVDRMVELTQVDFIHRKNRRESAGVHLVHPVQIGFGNNIYLDNLSLDVRPEGHIVANGRIGTTGYSIQARLQNIPLQLIKVFSDAALPEGTFDGEFSVKGSSSSPQGSMVLSLRNLGYPDSDIPAASLQIDGLLDDAGLGLKLIMDGLGGTPATGQLRLPLRFTAEGMPQLVTKSSLSGMLHWEGNLPTIWRFVPLANTSLRGQGYVDVSLTGTVENPQATATVKLIEADFEDILSGVLLTDINADVVLRSQGTSTFDFSAGDDRGGTVTMNGTIGSMVNGLPLHFSGSIHELAPLHRNDLDINLSGSTSITGLATSPEVRADITVNKGQFRILQSFGTAVPTLDVAESDQISKTEDDAGTGPQVDVSVTIPNQFFVRGAGVDSEWRGKLNVTGSASNPMIAGMIESVRGTFDLLGKQFSLYKGQVSFSGATPPNPLLNIQIGYQAPNITALASITGSTSTPVLTLSSQPPLPQDEIVAQILFGQGASSLGRMEAIQLATELASLSGFGRGKGGVLGEMRESLGVDVLRFGSMQEGGQRQQTGRRSALMQPGQNGNAESGESIPSLQVGKYVTDDIYVGFEQGMNEDASGVRVEIELTPRLNLEGSTTPQGSEVGINWKKDY